MIRCPAWTEERRVLREAVGNNLTLPRIVEKILGGEEAWKGFAVFCGIVMRRKEEAERVRKGEQPPPPPPQGGEGGIFLPPPPPLLLVGGKGGEEKDAPLHLVPTQ